VTTAESIVRAGFIPLLDAAPLVIAKEKGFAKAEGLDLVLSREMSWATIRDRLAVAHLDVAHALAPMPIAANLGLGPLPTRLLAPMALGFGGNTVTISAKLWDELVEAGAAADLDPMRGLRALASLVKGRFDREGMRLVLGIVHPHSAHHYTLAYWLAAGGLLPERDVDLVVIPPPLMGAALASGHIDGFCAGEPWGSVAVAEGTGVILTTGAHIWRSSPEKVLAARETWALEEPHRIDALVRAMFRACQWCEAVENGEEVAEILARPEYLGQSSELLGPGLRGQLLGADGKRVQVEGFLAFASRAATFPWASHALWFLAQMARWNEVELTDTAVETARLTYRPDIYRRALKRLGVDIPAAAEKVEGALAVPTPAGSSSGRLQLGPDGFFDGLRFDPDHLRSYVDSLQRRDRSFTVHDS